MDFFSYAVLAIFALIVAITVCAVLSVSRKSVWKAQVFGMGKGHAPMTVSAVAPPTRQFLPTAPGVHAELQPATGLRKPSVAASATPTMPTNDRELVDSEFMAG